MWGRSGESALRAGRSFRNQITVSYWVAGAPFIEAKPYGARPRDGAATGILHTMKSRVEASTWNTEGERERGGSVVTDRRTLTELGKAEGGENLKWRRSVVACTRYST